MAPALAAWAVIPFADGWVFADINAGLLYILAMTSIGVYGVIIAGWASNSKYALLGALRSAAQIVAYEIGLGATSIAAALLHDVVEDTQYTVEDMQQLFGETVARIVSGLTKISRLKQDQDYSIQAENFRKMLLTLHDDVRVILIKIADRLHNMQTMDAMPPHKQVKIASETSYIYAPLAHRIGLYNIKSELEDLGLKYTEPDVYNDILNKIKESKEEQDKYIQQFSSVIKKSLDKVMKHNNQIS